MATVAAPCTDTFLRCPDGSTWSTFGTAIFAFGRMMFAFEAIAGQTQYARHRMIGEIGLATTTDVALDYFLPEHYWRATRSSPSRRPTDPGQLSQFYPALSD